MEIIYNKPIKNNMSLKTYETQLEPKINININNNDTNQRYTLIMYDPDATNGTYVHWIVTNITNNNIKNGKILLPYKGPSPPPKTGKHRYIFELYLEGIIEPIDKRSCSIEYLRYKLQLAKPIYKIQFISQNENVGGKKRFSKKRLNTKFRMTKTKRHY